MTQPPLLTIALGGNALSPPAGDQSFAAERAAVLRTARALAQLARRGFRLLIVHGNGPQVGRLMRDDPEPADLDVRVAQTQGELGYLLIASLTDALGEPCVGVLTRVVVDPADTAFDAPSKPVGALLAARPPSGSAVAVSGGFRRVVASPRPLQVVEQSAIATLLASHHVVAGGGGGIPVAPGAASIAGVIDKDFVAALLAIAFDAHQLVFATNVPGVLDDFGTAAARLQATLRIDEASALLRAGRLAPGSMAPKVESAAQFAASTGRAALIVHTDDLSRVLEQPSPGTILLPD